MQLIELGKAIHEFGDRGTKLLDQFNFRDVAVFKRIVKQCGHERLRIQFPVGTLSSNCNRMGDVGLATVAKLSQVGFIGKAVGQADLFKVRGGKVVQFCGEIGKTCSRRIGCSQAWPPRPVTVTARGEFV